jgi:DNA-binding CsgD family transcriptional regulator
MTREVEGLPEVVGRDEELASIAAFVEGPIDGPSALVLEGEPGIGKSALWLAGVDRARANGMLVLTARPAEAESGLAFAGLGDLLDGVLDEVLPALTPPRRHALRVAMLRDDASDGPVDHRALAVAVRDALHALSSRRPVLIGVDDAPWLDAASTSALAFALRRLPGQPVLLLLTERQGRGPDPAALDAALDPERVLRLAVGALSVGALHRLLLDRVGGSFARQTLLRIHDQSGGNPFYALELAQALDRSASPALTFRVPETLDELLRSRLDGLPAATSGALAFVSAYGATPEALLERAGIPRGALDPAVAAHVVERENGIVRFTHPLLPSAIYQHLGEQRLRLHAAIARLVDDPIVRARHQALSRELPDGGIAGELDAAARRASDLGALEVAAELSEHAARLTPPEELQRRHGRSLAAARAHQAAGEWTRARAIVSGLLAEPAAGPWRAEALLQLAELESVDRAAALLEEALRDSGPRLELRSVIECRLAWVTRFRAGFEHARAALEFADRLGNEELRSRARAVATVLRWFAGEPTSPDDLPGLVRQLPDALGGERLVQEATQAIANTFAPGSVRDRARDLFEQEYREWHERDEPRTSRARWGLAWVEFWAGRWVLAAEHAAAAHDVAIQYGLEVPQDHLPITVIAAHRGQLELAREHAQRGLDLALEQFGFHPPQHLAALGLVAAGSGHEAEALGWFEQAQARAVSLGWREPSVRWWTADHAELLLASGRIDDAVRLLDAWESDARRVGRAWVLADAVRSHGLVAASRGDVEEAISLLAHAVEDHEAVDDPFGRARALLALGTVRRRARQKRAARDAIAAALDGFEQVGAAIWAAKTRAEQGRIGGRQSVEGLTPAERRVAALVAEGRTNREIAAALFLGERTVASHLTHVYAKLGVRSRTELAAKVPRF